MSRPGRRTLLSLFGVAALTACGGAPPVSAPTGVDGLEIPTPSPRPADFVDTISNRWLGFAPGAEWTYDVARIDAARAVVRLEAGADVAGVPTTAMVATGFDNVDRRVWVVRDLLAQDRAGNVWWCGRDVTGQAPDGIAAVAASRGFGLLMPHGPRLGDGFITRSGSADELAVAAVADIGVEVEVPAGSYERALRIRVREGLRREELSYVPEVGLVKRSGGTFGDWSLNAHTR